MFLSVCLSLCVTIAFSGNNQISQPHLVALCSFQKKINSLFLAKKFSAFPLPPQDSLPPIGLNWKVMKFLFKEMIDVYKNDLAGEKHGCRISVWFYARWRVCTVSNETHQVLSQCCCMKLPGFYISSTIWVLLPQQLMSQPKMVSFVSERRILWFTHGKVMFVICCGLKCSPNCPDPIQWYFFLLS